MIALALLAVAGTASAEVRNENYYYVGDQTTVTRSGPTEDGKDYTVSLSAPRVHEWDEVYTVRVKVADERDVVVEADGTHGDWKGFFNVSGRKNSNGISPKAQALADAIAGIGDAKAQKIIDAGYFSSKPRSWYEFSAVITSASNALGDSSIASECLYNADNAYKNKVRLGYYAVRHLPAEYANQLRSEHHKEQVGARRRTITLNVGANKLLAGESETFTVYFDGESDRVSASSEYNLFNQNRYGSGSEVRYELNPSRKANITPPNTVEVKVRSEGGHIFLVATDTAFDPAIGKAEAGQATLHVDFYEKVVDEHKTPWETMHWQMPIKKATTDIDTTKIYNPHRLGKHVWVKYTITRAGGQYYGDEASEEKTSQNEVVLKR